MKNRADRLRVSAQKMTDQELIAKLLDLYEMDAPQFALSIGASRQTVYRWTWGSPIANIFRKILETMFVEFHMGAKAK